MTEIERYIYIYCIRSMPNGAGIPSQFMKRSEIISSIEANFSGFLDDNSCSDIGDALSVSNRLFDDMLAFGIFEETNDRFAGEYLKYIPDQWSAFRKAILGNSELNSSANLIGDRFFPDVFSAHRSMAGERDVEGVLSDLRAPGSDRIVRFTDNQISELDAAADQVLLAVAEQNQIGDKSGFRELIIGQIKAGRELIRSGCARVYLLQIALIDALLYLIKRYEKEAIGAAASVFMAALAKHVGIEF